MPLCVVGNPEDLTSAYVQWVARKRGVDVTVLEEAGAGERWRLRFDDGSPGDGSLETEDGAWPLRDLLGAFVRLDPRPALPELARGFDAPVAGALVIERRAGLDYVLDRLPCPVMNRPSAGRSNSSKPFQMQKLALLGFDVPAWLVTTDGAEARRFLDRFGGGVICKSLSGVRSQVRLAGEDVLAGLANGAAPVLLQERAAGTDVRVHVVGSRCFATEIVSAGVDYRFEAADAVYRPLELPAALGRMCVDAARAEGLLLAGLDFRRSRTSWRCLELNPVPTFLPYEMSTGQPIAAGIVDLFLAGGPSL